MPYDKVKVKLKRKCSVLFLMCLLLFMVGCAQGDTANTNYTTNTIYTTNPYYTTTVQDTEADSPVTEKKVAVPKSGLELAGGSECAGVFDKSREILQLHAKKRIRKRLSI